MNDYNLIRLLEDGKAYMEIGLSFDEKWKAFCYFRYELIKLHFPHPHFSVEEAHFDFFEKTLDYLRGIVEIPKKEKDNTYKNNYIDWLNKYYEQYN